MCLDFYKKKKLLKYVPSNLVLLINVLLLSLDFIKVGNVTPSVHFINKNADVLLLKLLAFTTHILKKIH